MPGSKTPEQTAAAQLLKNVETLSAGITTLTEKLKEISTKVDGLESLDIKKALEEFDRLKAGFEEVRKRIRTTKDAMWFPGIEDVGKKFSLLRACLGHITRKWDEYAPYEKEVIEESRKAAESKAAGHVVGVDSSSGTFIPDQALDDLIPAIYTSSVWAALDGAEGTTRVTVLDGLFGMPVKIPRSYGGAVAYWIDEEEDYIESKLRTGLETLSPKKLGVMMSITDEMRRFATPAFDTMMRGDAVKALAKKLDWTIPYGTGTDAMPLGLVNMLRHGAETFPSSGDNKPGINHYYVETGEGGPGASAPGSPVGGEMDFDDFMNMMGVVEDLDLDTEPWSWISHHRLWRRLRQLKIAQFSGQTDRMSYLLGAPMISKQRLRDLIGDFGGSTQITSNATINSLAKFGDVFGGDLSQVLLGRWSGVEIVDDEGKGPDFKKDIINVKLRMYADVGTREERALVYAADARMRD